MIGENLRHWFRDFWGEYRRDGAGLVGIALLVLFVVLVAFEPLLIPFPETGRRWTDITYWSDNPQSAPPAWTNWVRSRKGAVQQVLRDYEVSVEESDGVKLVKRTFTYDFTYDLAPIDVVAHYLGTGDIPTSVSVVRPDGGEIELFRGQMTLGDRELVTISVDKDGSDAMFGFIREEESEDVVATLDASQMEPVTVLFSRLEPGMLANPKPLKGAYRFTLTTLILTEDRAADEPYFVVSGRVSGILGTDDAKRDLWSGLVVGTKWALLIGLLTAFVAVGIGVVWGIVSAYYRGWIEVVMQRIFEVFANMPLLPLLIVVSAVFKPSIWFIILIMCLFFWTGPVKTVYSMALQIKEETYIEASRAIGAKNRRIIFRHMVPLLVPYSFASMALYVPGAVVYEATVSLLGLGDAKIVSWGQILHDALRGGAVLNGLWWWVVPPGLLIALVGMTFAFVGFAMDRILHPKLRTR